MTTTEVQFDGEDLTIGIGADAKILMLLRGKKENILNGKFKANAKPNQFIWATDTKELFFYNKQNKVLCVEFTKELDIQEQDDTLF